LLAESLRVAHESGALRTKDLARVTVDTTVQPKNITFPTDAKLLHAAIKGLTRLARKHGVRLRQSYLRIAKRAAMMAGRYAHAKQFNRHRRQLRVLRTRVCTENLILFDYVTESPNINGDDRAALLLPDPVRLAVQVEEPTGGRERGAPTSADRGAAEDAWSCSLHER